MKQNFTKITLFFMAFIGSCSLYGQTFFPYLVSVEGTTDEFLVVNTPFFGVCNETPVAAELVVVDPLNGCDSIVSDLTGKIAVIDRGSCAFSDKARNAERKGAIAVIICNNLAEDDPEGGLIQMTLADDEMNDIAIPVYSSTLEDCAVFKTFLPAVGAVSPPPFAEADGAVLWGDIPEQGDFDGGLNGWTTRTVDCNGAVLEVDTWRWDGDGIDDTGSFANAFTPGPTFCNGFMVFNSDFLDNNGMGLDENGNQNDESFGTGECPAPQYGELISPIIDLSGTDAAGVAVEFWQETAQFDSRYFVEYSLDGGENYNNFEEINQDLEMFTIENNKVSVSLSGAAKSDQLRIKFTYIGNYYYWAIDDVKIVERPANNLRVNRDFFATAPNVLRPKSQIESIPFLADIENIGAVTQENVTLSVSITNDADGTEVFSDAVNLGSVIPDSIAQNTLFPNQFTPAEEVANYTGVYTISADAEDFDDSDNFRTFSFGITEDEFANESGPNYGALRITDATQIPTWAVGNYFYVPNGAGWKVSKFGIGIANASEVGGLDVGVRMFKWVDMDEDSDGSGFAEAAPNERELVGFVDYEILGSEMPDDINFIEVGQDDEILLEDDAHYIVMMTMDAAVNVSIRDNLFDSYLAMNLATTEAGKPRFWSFFGESDNPGESDYNAFQQFTPLVRMYITKADGTAVTELSADNLIEVSPNPATNQVLLNMEFTKPFEAVQVVMTDVAGRVVLDRDFENVQQHQMRIDVSNLASGTFILNIRTPEGIRTEKFMKVE